MKNLVNKELIIYGPTTTGKTALAIDLAKKYNGEIISADSRQVYKGLDIGTGKVSFDSKVEKHKGFWIVDDVKVYGFDLVKVGEQFTAADFLTFASTTMIRIIVAKKLPIVVGGTGFYIKALIEGIGSIGVKPDWQLRRKLEKLDTSTLYQKLLEVNPTRARSMNQSDRANPRRLIRAIEIALLSQKSEVKSQKSETTHYPLPTIHYLLIGLTAPNDFLYQRADYWLDVRLEHGMIEEVRALLDHKVSPKWLDDLGLEYRWVSRYLKNKIDYNQMVERLKGDIHSFIRRKKTWFHKFKNNLPASRQVKLYDISKSNWQEQIEKTI